ncbi:MAG: hypothetical protein WCH46_00600 [bacterium]
MLKPTAIGELKVNSHSREGRNPESVKTKVLIKRNVHASAVEDAPADTNAID